MLLNMVMFKVTICDFGKNEYKPVGGINLAHT